MKPNEFDQEARDLAETAVGPHFFGTQTGHEDAAIMRELLAIYGLNSTEFKTRMLEELEQPIAIYGFSDNTTMLEMYLRLQGAEI